MAQVIPELIYRSVIQDGVLWLKQHITRITSSMSGYSAQDLADIRDYLQTHEISVIQGYPRINTPFPCYAIVLGGESDQAFIDDMLGIGDDGMNEGRLWGAKHTILIVSDNPDLTVFLYQMLKLILERSAGVLNESLHEIAYEGGELSPDQSSLPDHLYARQMSISAQYFVQVTNLFDPVTITAVHTHIVPEGTAPWGEGAEGPQPVD